ncbi:MAG: hypothetical protein Q8N99_08745 [Nanoarchaeota archaeon]|nr:hypothetical protein [Nanoarchaeota archaeon]
MISNKTICLKCKSKNIIKWCKRKTENRGLIQRYKCKDCGKYFVIDDGFYRMRNSPQKITCAMDLYFKGLSTRKVQDHFQAFYPHNSSWVSIYNWVIKYSKQISKFTETLKLQSGEEVQIDEIEYKRRKSHKKGEKGTEDNYFVDSIDPITKFMVASNYVQARGNPELEEVAKRIKTKTEKQVKMVTTDGLLNYEGIVKSVWGYNNKLGKYNVFHNRIVTSKEEDVFNYQIERLHNSIRARTKVMRGFHGSVISANAIMKGYEIYYNFITKHQAINCCPYELATDLQLKSNNKWLELVEMSVIN